MSVEDTPALHIVYSKPGLLLQDFIAPFYIFLKSQFRITYFNIDDILHANEITLSSEIDNYLLNYKTIKQRFFITLTREGIHRIEIRHKNKSIIATCIKED